MIIDYKTNYIEDDVIFVSEKPNVKSIKQRYAKNKRKNLEQFKRFSSILNDA